MFYMCTRETSSTQEKSNTLLHTGYCEVAKTATEYILKIVLPGFTKDDISVEEDNRKVFIKAERKNEKKEGVEYLSDFPDEMKYSQSFNFYNDFGGVESAKYENGILTIVVKRKEDGSRKKIEISS